jgi:hypothetical protein
MELNVLEEFGDPTLNCEEKWIGGNLDLAIFGVLVGSPRRWGRRGDSCVHFSKCWGMFGGWF